jgi:asparagine synthase (glutamine-hydrolysing)
MCGILGYASVKSEGDIDWLARGIERLTHRGPDDQGRWYSEDGRFGLAHRRLAILDLSSAGHQPMLSRNNTIVLVFNGEIYNFQDLKVELAGLGVRFETNCDTEVVLAAYQKWGCKAFQFLNGMFAIAIVDMRENKLILARDRAGEKPLFYWLTREKILFGSELKAMFENASVGRVLSLEALEWYLSNGFVPSPLSMIRGINKLVPGSYLVFDGTSGEHKIEAFWDVPPLDKSCVAPAAAERELTDGLEELLSDSVRRQLVADVPVGVFLSGGVDSSLMVALAARTGKRIKSFTASFPGHENFDEAKHARLIASHFETDHIELVLDDVDESVLPMLARQFDEPIIDSSMIACHLLMKAAREHCKVAIGGDGADELFGGYTSYRKRLQVKSWGQWLPPIVSKALSGVSSTLLPTGFPGKRSLQLFGHDFRTNGGLCANHFDRRERHRLFGRGLWSDRAKKEVVDVQRQEVVFSDFLDGLTRVDFRFYLCEDVLVKVDRASMLNSLEVRSPFLDHRVIEFAFSKVPSYLKTNVSEQKILLKRLASRLLPSEFDLVRKQGFSVPLSVWLKKPGWRRMVEDVLMSKGGLFDQKEISGLIQGLDCGRGNSERIFGLVMFELWRRQYKIVLER